jgi:hypothetical protein
LFKDSTSAPFGSTHRLGISKRSVISKAREIGTQDLGLAVSLLFAAGRRPDADSIHQLSEKQPGFAISFNPRAQGTRGQDSPVEPGQEWLELLINGLTFDLVGLSPGTPAPPPPCVHAYALPDDADPAGMEAVTIRPGPHLTGGHTMIPVVRSLAWLAATLAQIDGVEAIAWHAARSWCGPEYFRQCVLRWIEGGVFPSLGLTSLAIDRDGGMRSEGLAFFTGQDLRVEPELMTDKVAGGKIAVRLIDHLVGVGRIDATQRINGPDGSRLRLEPSANGLFVRAWRG